MRPTTIHMPENQPIFVLSSDSSIAGSVKVTAVYPHQYKEGLT
jgi:hypothetical protein